MSRTRMCDPCKEKWDAWTHYQAPVGRWLQYPVSVVRSLEAKSAVLSERAMLIDWQCRLIREVCLRDHDE